jgi:hypothetical protein
MKFRVHRLQFLRIIDLLTTKRLAGRKDHLIRICARDASVRIACNDEEAGCEANIESPGVCFLRHDKLRRLLQTYHSDPRHKKQIDIEVNSEGICIGQTNLSRTGWEVSFFMDPDMAPLRLNFDQPNDPGEVSHQLEFSLNEGTGQRRNQPGR